jgi:hypothetical protein
VDDDAIEGERWIVRQFFAGPETSAPGIEAILGAGGREVRIRAIPRLGSSAGFPLLVYHHEREVGVLRTVTDELALDSQALGAGPVRLRARSSGERLVWSKPLTFELAPFESQ